MERFKKFNEAAEVADISVGKKKAKPTGVKADEPLKGYAYNEKKRVTDIDVEQSARDLELAKNKKAKEKVQNEESEMSLDDIKKKYAKEIIAYQDGDSNKLSNGAEMALYGYRGSDAIKTDDADEFDDFVMGLKMGSYKKTNEQQSMDTLLDMLEETNLDEALSPKEKEKRLQMIKKAVEKLNKANIERVKKMAMRDMKAAGMFDDAIEEAANIGGYRDNSRDGQQGPEDQKKQREREAARAKRDSTEGQIEMYKKRIDDLEKSQREIESKAAEARDKDDDDRAERLEDQTDRIQNKINGFRDELADLRKGK